MADNQLSQAATPAKEKFQSSSSRAAFLAQAEPPIFPISSASPFFPIGPDLDYVPISAAKSRSLQSEHRRSLSNLTSSRRLQKPRTIQSKPRSIQPKHRSDWYLPSPDVKPISIHTGDSFTSVCDLRRHLLTTDVQQLRSLRSARSGSGLQQIPPTHKKKREDGFLPFLVKEEICMDQE